MDLPDLGEDWPTVEGYRYRKNLPNRICWTRIFINPFYSDIVSDIGSGTDPIYVMIEKRYNEKITEVQQQISAVIISPEIAKHVKAKPGSTGSADACAATLAATTSVLEVTISIHPSDRFRYDQKTPAGIRPKAQPQPPLAYDEGISGSWIVTTAIVKPAAVRVEANHISAKLKRIAHSIIFVIRADHSLGPHFC